MTDQELIAGNRLIRTFMEHDVSSIRYAYSSDWNALMSVVAKIESLELDRADFEVWIHRWRTDIVSLRKGHSIRKSRFEIDVEEAGSKILATYQSILKFIKWYNEQGSQHR